MKFFVALGDKPVKFERFMFNFSALSDGFISRCTHFIKLDRCYLKGLYGDILLSTIALYANNEIFPIVVCICKSKCAETYNWLLDILQQWLGIENNRRATFMINRQKGIKIALGKMAKAIVRHYA